MINLLVVEDSPVFAEALALMLQGNKCLNIVEVVETAEKALQIVRNLDIDLVLVDISLPKMDGIEFVRKLRQSFPDIPCIILSGKIRALKWCARLMPAHMAM